MFAQRYGCALYAQYLRLCAALIARQYFSIAINTEIHIKQQTNKLIFAVKRFYFSFSFQSIKPAHCIHCGKWNIKFCSKIEQYVWYLGRVRCGRTAKCQFYWISFCWTAFSFRRNRNQLFGNWFQISIYWYWYQRTYLISLYAAVCVCVYCLSNDRQYERRKNAPQ